MSKVLLKLNLKSDLVFSAELILASTIVAIKTELCNCCLCVVVKIYDKIVKKAPVGKTSSSFHMKHHESKIEID